MIPILQTKGITVHTVGLLAGSNTMMQSLASETGGRALTATSAQELDDAFTALTRTIPVILTK